MSPDNLSPSDASRDDPDRTADELIEAAATSSGSEARLWRLEWAQAFKRLADITRRGGNSPENQ